MCVVGGGFDPAVTEEPADDRQAFSERERPRGKAVAVPEPEAGTPRRGIRHRQSNGTRASQAGMHAR